MKSKFSPKFVIRDFFKFHSEDKYKIIGLPLLISCFLIFLVNINMELVNILLVSLSIFIGFLLNLMLSSFNLKESNAKSIEVNGKNWNIEDFLVEYHITISFEILITIFLVMILLFVSLTYKNLLVIPMDLFNFFKYLFNFIIIYLLSLFFLVIFRVLKFGHILIKYHINN